LRSAQANSLCAAHRIQIAWQSLLSWAYADGEVAECLIAAFEGLTPRPTFEHARDLLMKAARTGKEY
jgi:hypothetical protein